MTKFEFRAKCYEILEKNGHIEQNGTLYYPEASIMDLIEFLREAKVSFEKGELQKNLNEVSELIKNILP